MSKEIPWGKLNTNKKPAQKTSWPANTTEVVESKKLIGQQNPK